MAQSRLLCALPCGGGGCEVGEVTARDGHCFGLVSNREVDHPVGHLHRERTDLVGVVDTEATALDHGRPAHADRASLRCDDNVATAEQRSVAGEAPTRRDAHERNGAGQLGEELEGEAVEPGHTGSVDVARAAAATLGQQHDGQPLAFRQHEEPVLLAVVLVPLRAGQHHVVVRRHDDRVAVDAGDAADQAVGRGVADEVVEVAATPLSRNRERPVLDEGSGIDEVGQVLTGGALTASVAAANCVGPGRVPPELVAPLDGGQIGSVGDRMSDIGVLRRVVLDQGRIDRDQDLAGTHRVAHRHSNVDDLARHLGDDEMLHLHGLEHGEGLPGANTVAGDDFERDDSGLHRRHHGHQGQTHDRVLAEKRPTRPGNAKTQPARPGNAETHWEWGWAPGGAPTPASRVSGRTDALDAPWSPRRRFGYPPTPRTRTAP